ncbi:erythromycin biosynthesis sensory transduction protein eryC1 [Roseivirga seohaensis subsp. aquiponti]|uniref:Erythromycin biosynthesis sensory transduction protein eryC1 n=1 Tax=Roseivirga seohaensis subsp. aquiponti TaxID=1566026 RepID=A0A0L8ALH5_9BACT|nr:DegT/DnrJ/EryC1/StrS family aminotransferase [Roseivirga seohaensis]KOF03030.1 erythromycin biosynthesis sensory transduction protein eryC1 [Roseivirga seohaensis subsp. aquiponti]
MEIPFLDLKRQYLSIKTEMDTAVQSVIDEHRFIGGEVVSSFEKAFAKAHKTKHCIGVGNATDALFVILKSLGIGNGDEVIVPAHGWLSAAEMVSLSGATPVFADVEMKRFGLDPISVEAKITARTKAIIPIHLYGQICEIEALAELSEKHHLYLIEDAAQAHFAEKNGKMAGSWGIASAFSFYPSKILGAFGDGGAILTNDDIFAKQCRMFANHGGLSKNDHQVKGINSRLDTLQAAVLNVKLNHVEKWIEARNRIAKRYSEAFKDIQGIITPEVNERETHNFHIYCLRVKNRDALKVHFQNAGISTEIHYPLASPLTPAFKANDKPEGFPNSFQLQNEVLSLPIYPELTDAEIEYVIKKVKEFNQ